LDQIGISISELHDLEIMFKARGSNESIINGLGNKTESVLNEILEFLRTQEERIDNIQAAVNANSEFNPDI
jgi:hypothetical protein